ncbi:acyltransferase family protein [Nocardioides sp. WV_118_6]|uniref:acyltransferase family protein n=1 Tax=Nocardioides simplex TaxID=2045 RepID=UPI0021505763|nr:acyltransferase family protein [Pimelobacter simplex]UUW90404.1 acyltransferase family protein [Pimelobacter simplex]UUW94234.1 acyltransferase family protein [Pimelobacter simplex]
MSHALLPSAAALADRTPPERNRVVDLLRAVAILVVVLGHWLMAAVYVDREGGLHRGDLLDLAAWTHPLTWVLQVMPVFFLVGGYANALSWRSARRRAQPYGGWLRSRLRRLVLPVLPLMVFWAVLAPAAHALGADPDLLRIASRASLVPTWFLAAYVVVVAVAPLTLLAWERAGWWAVAGGLALGGLVDYVSVSRDLLAVGFLNYVVVWSTVHMLGYAWLDGRLASAGRRLALVVLGLGVLWLLTVHGPYAVSMVGVSTDEIDNAYPTRVTQGFLGLLQAGVVLSLEPLLRRLVARRRVWVATVLVNGRIMSIYLWHLTMLGVLVAGSLALDGLGLHRLPDTAGWWATRPLYFGVLALLTAGAVALVGRFETPAADPRPAPAAWRPVLAVLGVCGGLGALAALGIARDGAILWYLPLVPIAACLVGGVVRLPGSLGRHAADPAR